MVETLMEPARDYYIAWLIYLAAVLAAELLLWRGLHKRLNRDVLHVLQILVFALLITPATLDITQAVSLDGYWVPAFMAALMEGINEGFPAAMTRLTPVWVVMLVLLLLALVWRLRHLIFKR